MPQAPRLIPNAGRTNPKPVVHRLIPRTRGAKPKLRPPHLISKPWPKARRIIPGAGEAMPAPEAPRLVASAVRPKPAPPRLVLDVGIAEPKPCVLQLHPCAAARWQQLHPVRCRCPVPGGNSSHPARLLCGASSQLHPCAAARSLQVPGARWQQLPPCAVALWRQLPPCPVGARWQPPPALHCSPLCLKRGMVQSLQCACARAVVDAPRRSFPMARPPPGNSAGSCVICTAPWPSLRTDSGPSGVCVMFHPRVRFV